MTEDLVIVGATHRRTDKVSWALDLTGGRWTYLKKNAYVMSRANAAKLIASRSSDRHDFFTSTWAEDILPGTPPASLRKATTPQPRTPPPSPPPVPPVGAGSGLTHEVRPFPPPRFEKRGVSYGHIAVIGLFCMTALALAMLPGAVSTLRLKSYQDGYHRAWREMETQYKACRVRTPDECHILASALLRMPLPSDVEPE